MERQWKTMELKGEKKKKTTLRETETKGIGE